MLRNTILAGLGLLLLLTVANPAPNKPITQFSTDNHNLTQATVPQDTVVAAPAVTEPAPTAVATTPVAEPEPQAPQPASWAVTRSPHSRVSVDTINVVLAHLQARGLTKEGAAYLTGNFISESYLEPDNCHGDGGTACGLAQWRGARQVGMPTTLLGQVDWALDYEMPHHAQLAGYMCACDAVKTSDINLITYSLKNWEVYGLEGGRWNYARQIYEQL